MRNLLAIAILLIAISVRAADDYGYVTEVVYDEGSNAAKGIVAFIPIDRPLTNSGGQLVVGAARGATIGTNGAVSARLFRGWYDVVFPGVNQTNQAYITAGTTNTLRSLLTNRTVTTSVSGVVLQGYQWGSDNLTNWSQIDTNVLNTMGGQPLGEYQWGSENLTNWSTISTNVLTRVGMDALCLRDLETGYATFLSIAGGQLAVYTTETNPPGYTPDTIAMTDTESGGTTLLSVRSGWVAILTP